MSWDPWNCCAVERHLESLTLLAGIEPKTFLSQKVCCKSVAESKHRNCLNNFAWSDLIQGKNLRPASKWLLDFRFDVYSDNFMSQILFLLGWYNSTVEWTRKSTSLAGRRRSKVWKLEGNSLLEFHSFSFNTRTILSLCWCNFGSHLGQNCPSNSENKVNVKQYLKLKVVLNITNWLNRGEHT